MTRPKALSPDGWVRRFRRAGFPVERGAKHWKVTAPGGLLVFAATPSDPKWEHYLRREIRKRGLDLTARPPSNRQLSLVESGVERTTDVGSKSANKVSTVKARARLREVTDEINSLLPGHRGAFSHIARELLRYGRARDMQTWPTESAGQQTLRAMYSDTDAGFADWAVALVNDGLDSVGMPERPSERAMREMDEDEATGRNDSPKPPTAPADGNPAAATQSLEVFYHLVKGGMRLDDAYDSAKLLLTVNQKG